MSETMGQRGRTRQLRLIRMRTDYVLVVVLAALLILGLMMVYSSSFDLAYRLHDNPIYYLRRQILWMGVGTVVLIVAAQLDYRLWQRWAVWILLGALLLQGAVLAFGTERNGAQRWLTAGGSIQPSEIAKLAMIIYVAAWATSKGDKIRQLTYGLIPFAVLLGLVTALVLFQDDMSTAVIIAATSLAMFFFAGADLMQLAVSFLFLIATFVVLVIKTPFRLERWKAYLDPLADPTGTAYQAQQSLIALASGGFLGRGLGSSRQKLDAVLPAVHTDTIVAVLGEELGLLGCLVLVGLFVLLAYRGFKISLEAQDSFGTILGTGLTCSLILQALINLAVVTSTVPTAGVPMPFISYGGSSLVTSMATVGLLLSVSRGPQSVKERDGARARLGRGNWGPRVSPADRRKSAQRRV